MGTEEDLLRIGRRLEKRISEQSTDRILDLLKELQRFQVTVSLLRSTRIGVTVNKLKKQSKDQEIGELAKSIIRDWKRLLENSYKNNGAPAGAVVHSPTKVDHEKKEKEEKKLHVKRLPSATDKSPHPEKGSPRPESSKSLSQQPATQDPKCDCPESRSPAQNYEKTSKDSKLKRSHSTDVQTSSNISKKQERRLSLNTTLPSSSGANISSNNKDERRQSMSSPISSSRNGPNKHQTNTKEERKHSMSSPTSSSPNGSSKPSTNTRKEERRHSMSSPTSSSPNGSGKSLTNTRKEERRHSMSSPSSSSRNGSNKSSTNTKEERRHSLSSPTSLSCNGSNKPSTTTKEERLSAPLACSPTCSSPPSLALLSNSYVTGNSVRDKCVEMIASALKTDDDYKTFGVNCDKIAWEIEESIYKEMKATDMKYRNRIRSRISNLKDPKNPNLRRNVLCGVVSPQNIATMTAEEMASDELKELRNTLTQEAIREHQMAKTGGTQTDLLQCDKCKKKNCTYNQVQTRSADEPMTTFVLCNECGHRWKFC
ncbi:transcription elongation factor A protein 3-like [Dendropsophus ebraccatus]|uniref:transcription elongation factor A protein 3-like n=1 Tax=Dendropsophus ebraccatus TaxID=150705 RepID=UPI003831A6E8